MSFRSRTFTCIALSIPDLPKLGSLGRYSLCPDSDDNFQFIEGMLQHCIESHEKCFQSGTALSPKRLLSINAIDHDEIKLVERDDFGIRYIALSHCWGTHQPIKTTSSNLSQMKINISWHKLSKVFQDTIKIARRLNVHWIWIDSLCIIQDSKSDWEIESSKMCDYYSNAWLTISASSSKDGTIPFLHQRAETWWPVSFTFTNSDGSESHIQARRHQGSSMTQQLEDLGPLASRGWVWQENVLSARVLHFTEAELIWECRSELRSEDGAVPRSLYSMRLPQWLLQSEREVYQCWHSLIESYSVRKLTFESDRLPAVSGVASKIQETVGSDVEYLAGLWKSNMPLELCWSVDYESAHSPTPQIKPDSFIAPSWSWASVHGPLSFVDKDPNSPFESQVTIVQAKCNVPGLNPYGEVTNGSIILRGPVVPMKINCADPYECWTYTVGDDPETKEPMAPDCMLTPFETNGKKRLRRARQGDIPIAFSMVVECIQLGHESGENGVFIYGLLLGPSEVEADEYARLGLVVLDSDDWFEEAIEKTVKIV